MTENITTHYVQKWVRQVIKYYMLNYMIIITNIWKCEHFIILVNVALILIYYW